MPPKKSRRKQVEEQEQFEAISKKKGGRRQKPLEKTKPISKEILKNKYLNYQLPSEQNYKAPFKSYATILCKKQVDSDFFQCCLCYTIFVEPQVTICGHTFCKKCITESLLYRTTCPICKFDLKETTFMNNVLMKKFISEKLKSNKDIRKQYEKVIESYKKWFEEKQVPEETLEEGLTVDFRDKDYYWISAKVSKIDDHKHVTFKFTRNGATHSEVLPIYSERIAKENSIMGLRDIRKIEQRTSNRSIFFTVQRPINPPLAASRINFLPERQMDVPPLPVARDDQQFQELRQSSVREVGLFSNFFQIDNPPSLSPFHVEPQINQLGFDNREPQSNESPFQLQNMFEENNDDINHFFQ